MCCFISKNKLPVFAARWQFHEHIYAQLFHVNDKKAALKKAISQTFLYKIFARCAENLQGFFWHKANCYLPIVICHSCEKAACKYVDEMEENQP
jgi:hypothetical protein